MANLKKYFCGTAICAVIAAAAMWLSGLSVGSFSLELIGAPVMAILFGMIISLIAPKLASGELFKGGIAFTSKKVLQWAVIILGFSLNLNTILAVGAKSLPVIVCTISVSLVTAFLLMKVLKIAPKTATLIGVGSSICGGSAIAATAPVIDADDEDVAQSISVIFLFNILAALIFPTLGHAIGFGTEGFAVFAGTAVNDTSSVTAAASTAEELYGVSGILSAAVTVKLTRTLAIIPITLALALYRAKKAKSASGEEGAAGGFSLKKIFPWFILYFIAASVITTVVTSVGGSSGVYSEHFVPAMKLLAKFFIAMAMCAIGLNTNVVTLVKKGGKPMILGLCCWVAITLVSIGVQYLTGIYTTNL